MFKWISRSVMGLLCGFLAIWSWVPFFEPWGAPIYYIMGIFMFLFAVGIFVFVWVITE